MSQRRHTPCKVEDFQLDSQSRRMIFGVTELASEVIRYFNFHAKHEKWT